MSYIPLQCFMPPARLEHATPRLGISCSILLSYGGVSTHKCVCLRLPSVKNSCLPGRAFWFCFPFSTISVDLLCIWITELCVQCSVFSLACGKSEIFFGPKRPKKENLPD